MEQTESDQGEEGYWWKEGEGTRQRTCMNDSQTCTTVWELTVGRGGGISRKGAKGEKLGQL